MHENTHTQMFFKNMVICGEHMLLSTQQESLTKESNDCHFLNNIVNCTFLSMHRHMQCYLDNYMIFFVIKKTALMQTIIILTQFQYCNHISTTKRDRCAIILIVNKFLLSLSLSRSLALCLFLSPATPTSISVSLQNSSGMELIV